MKKQHEGKENFEVSTEQMLVEIVTNHSIRCQGHEDPDRDRMAAVLSSLLVQDETGQGPQLHPGAIFPPHLSLLRTRNIDESVFFK